MKVLIFSDTHFTQKFDKKKFNFLLEIIKSSDQVIINGDFWDSWFTDFEGFVNSGWKDLFPILKKKNAIYIYGNHDSKEKCDSRVNLFSIKALEKYILRLPNQIYTMEHGHKILEGEKGKLLEIYSSILKKTEKTPFRNVIYKLLHNLEYLGYKYIGMKLMTQSKVAQNNNKIMKKSKHSGFLICGDTHCAEIDKINLFANSGTINYGFASYLLITDESDESIELYKRNY